MMEKRPDSCSRASLVAIVTLILFPVTTWCKADVYKSLTAVKKECCDGVDSELNQFGDIDYESFVSLMGRRSAAQPSSHKSIAMSGAGRVEDILTDLLGWRRSDRLR